MTRGQIKREAKKQRRRDILEELGMAVMLFIGMAAIVILMNFLF